MRSMKQQPLISSRLHDERATSNELHANAFSDIGHGSKIQRSNGNDTGYGGYTLVTLPRIVTPYRDSADGTRDRVTYRKLVTR